MRWIRIAERAGTGLALAAVVLACGLARHARAPVQSGTAPGTAFATATFSQPGAASGAREAISYAELGRIAASGVGGEWVTSLPLTRQVFVAGRSMGRQTLGWSTGPLFASLHVPLVGRAFPVRDLDAHLHGSAAREIVLTEHAARAWFGSVADAVGKTVEVEPIGVGAESAGNVAFVVVGVATSAFVGPSPDRGVVGWVPLGAWPGVVMPRSFEAALSQLRPEYLGIETRPDVETASAALDRLLSETASPLRATLSRGLGLTAQRRAVLATWSWMLLLNAIAVAAAFGAMHLSSRLVQLLGEETREAIRHALGETRSQRWWRRIRSELRVVLLLLVVACAAVLVAWAVAPRLPDFPIRESIVALTQGRSILVIVGAFLASLAVAPLALSRLALGAPSLTAARRNLGAIRASSLALVGLSFAAVLLATGAAAVTFERVRALLERNLGFQPAGTWYAELRRDASGDHGFPATLDGRALATVAADAGAGSADADIALASAPPVGAPQVVSATIGEAAASGSEMVSINFVTPSYFRVLGIAVDRLCAPLGTHAERQVIVNAAFVRRYGVADGSLPTIMTAQVPNAGAPVAFAICGVAADAQFLDTRASPLPTIYAPLTRIGNAGAVIGRGDPTAPLARVEAALAAALPEYHVKRARTMTRRIADDLRPDQALATMSQMISLLVVGLSIAMCVLTLTAAAAMLQKDVAVRWSLGSSRARLTTSLLFTPTPWSIAACVLVNSAAIMAIIALAPGQPAGAVVSTVGCAFLVAASCVSAGMVVVARRFDDRALARALAA